MSEIQEEEIDLREYINVLLKRKGIIILIFLIAVITAAIVSYFILQPVYEANTVITVSKPKIGNSIVSEPSLEDYKNLITDNALEEELIQKLNLNKPPLELTPYDLEQMLTIESPKDTNLIKMNLQASEPKLTKDIINTWATLFVEKNKRLYFEEVKKAKTDVEEKFKPAEHDFFEIEDKLMKFNETSYVKTIEDEIKYKTTKKLDFKSRLIDIQLSLEKEKAEKEQINKALNGQEKTLRLNKSIVDDQFFQQLISNITDANLKIANLTYVSEVTNLNVKTIEDEIEYKAKKILSFKSRLIDIQLSFEKENAKKEQVVTAMNEQGKVLKLNKSIVDDQFFQQLISNITDANLKIANLTYVSEVTNPIYYNLAEQLISTNIEINSLAAEENQLEKNINDFNISLKGLREELTEKKLILSQLNIYYNLTEQLISTNIEINSLAAEENQLEKNINDFDLSLEDLKPELTEKKLILSQLNGEYSAKEKLYNNLYKQAEEIRLTETAEADLLKIASLAHEPNVPIKPNRKLNILIAGVLGLFVGIFVAFFLEFWQKGKS